MNEGDLTLEAAKSLFLMNRESRNYSPKTVRWYSDMIGRFAEWFGADEKIASIDANAIREYARSVRDRDLSKFTRHAYMRTLKTFLRWLESEDYLTDRVSKKVELPRVPKYEDVTIEVLTDEEIAHLLSVFDTNTDVGARDRAIAEQSDRRLTCSWRLKDSTTW